MTGARLRPTSVPAGVGLYLTRAAYGDRGNLSLRVRRAVDARARWVCLCIGGDDGWEAPLEDVERVASAYAGAGIAVWVWALDSLRASESPFRCARRLLDRLLAVDGAGVVLDLEAAWKGKAAGVRALVDAVVDGLTERHGLGVTSYPVARYHPELPWEEMAVGWGGPQLYKTAERHELALQAIEDWRRRHDVVVPHLAAFDVGMLDEGTQAEQLRRHLELAPDDSPGVAIWADAALDRRERQVLADFAAARGW